MKKTVLTITIIFGLIFGLSFIKGKENKYEKLILDFKDSLSDKEIEEKITEIEKTFQVKPVLNSIFSKNERLYIVKGNKELLDRIRKSDTIKNMEYAEPNYIYNAYDIPNDPLFDKQWNLKMIHIEKAWEKSQGEGVIVAVIDTGVFRVKDLADTEFVEGYDFVNHKKEAIDDNGHGTHVAGTIAQSTNNKLGTAGIAFKAKIMPLKVLDAYGAGNIADIAEAIKFAADNKADVINLSLGGFGENRLMKKAIDYAYKKGVVIVAAAGNESNSESSYPARYPNVISVSALGPNGELAGYSNHGAGLNIAAPGGDKSVSEEGGILQNTINPETKKDDFYYYQGTSMASPHVAGVAALIKSLGIKDPQTVQNILEQSADKINDPNNFFGAGKLNALKAVDLALSKDYQSSSITTKIKNSGLTSQFYFSGKPIDFLPKISMLIMAFILSYIFQKKEQLKSNFSLNLGIILGSSGFFILKAIQIFAVPQWFMLLMGSSIPEIGSIYKGSGILNPITANALIPLILIITFISAKKIKWFIIGAGIGITSCLFVSGISPNLMWIGSDTGARVFLFINALLSFLFVYFASKSAKEAR